MTNPPLPTELTDIVLKSDEYINFLRQNPQDGNKLMNHLADFVGNNLVDKDLDLIIVQKLAGDLIDGLYIQTIALSSYDNVTHAYYKSIISYIFTILKQKNVFAFHIIDNKIRDDRFKLHCELSVDVDLQLIHPYDNCNLNFSDTHTVCSPKKLEDVVKEITKAIYEDKHIIYIEKDDSVNYLSNVLQIAEDWQNKYICIFRNKDIDEPKKWLLGSFADTLNNVK